MADDPTPESVKARFDGPSAKCGDVPLDQLTADQLAELQQAQADALSVLDRQSRGAADGE